MIIYIISQVRDFTSSNSWLSRAAMCKCSHFKFHSPILRIPGLCLFFFILPKSCHFSHNADLHDLLGHPCRLLPSSQVSCLCNQAEHQFITDAREHVIYHLAILLLFICKQTHLMPLQESTKFLQSNNISLMPLPGST